MRSTTEVELDQYIDVPYHLSRTVEVQGRIRALFIDVSHHRYCTRSSETVEAQIAELE